MKIIRNILGLLGGLLAGGIVNGAIVSLGHHLYPIEGYTDGDMESLALAMENLSLAQLLFPFVAHAVGTMVGALFAYIISYSYKATFALIVGVFFLIGGITMVYLVGEPWWFVALDLVFAYLPMAYLAIIIGRKIQPAKKVIIDPYKS